MTTTQFRATELYNNFEKVFYDPKYQEWSTFKPYTEKTEQEIFKKTDKKL